MMLPSVEDTERARLDMTIGEVVSILGKPQIAVGSGSIIYSFYLSNGQVFLAWWDSHFMDDKIYSLWRMELLDENPFRIYLYERLSNNCASNQRQKKRVLYR